MKLASTAPAYINKLLKQILQQVCKQIFRDYRDHSAVTVHLNPYLECPIYEGITTRCI